MASKYIIVVNILLLLDAMSQPVHSFSNPRDAPVMHDDSLLDNYINSLLQDDSDLMNDVIQESRQSDFSGDTFSSENATTMQQIMDLMFRNQYEDDNQTSSPVSVGSQHAENKGREKKSSVDDKKTVPQAEKNYEVLQKIEKILVKYNLTTRSAKGSLFVFEGPDQVEQALILQICSNYALPEFATIKSKLPTLTDQDNKKLEELMSSTKSESPSKEMPDEKCPNVIYGIETTKSPLFHMSQIHQFAKDCFVDDKVIADIERGVIEVDEVSMLLLTCEDFILAQFPVKFGEMLEKDRVPSEIKDVLFIGRYPLDELKKMVYSDDRISKALLPERIREILEDRPPPMELKEMLFEGHNHTVIIHETLRNETLIESMMSESMFYFYNLFKVQRNVILNMALSGTTIVALVCVMTSLGCTMTVKDIMAHVRRPKGVLIALFSQYGVMPAAAFALTQAFDLGVYPAIAVLICGCCPGGNLSNILAFAINGDMNLSILMTTCSSVFGLAMMPLLLFCYSRYIIPIDGAEIVPFDKIVLNIALTIVPVSLGITIKHYRPTWTKNIMRFGAVMLLLCSITFSVIAGFLLGDKFFSFFPQSVVVCAAILPITGYIIGFILARLVREDQKCSRTISVETGCQNVQLCGTVLKLAFDPVLIGAMILLPIIYMAFQAAEALLLITIYRLYERCCSKNKKSDDDDEEIKFDDEEKKLERSDSETKEPEDNGDAYSTTNGKKKSSNDKKENSDAGENWPLMPHSDKSLKDSFENSKENYV